MVNNNNVISNSGCLSYLGDVVVPVIYSSIKLSDNLLEVVLEEHRYKYTFSGQLVHNGEVLPSGLHAYEQLKDNILIVKQYTGREWDISFLHGIYDVNAKNFIIPVEYTSLIDTTSNTFIVCKGGKYGLLNKDYYGIDACNNAIEVAVGLQGFVAMPDGTTTLGVPDFLRHADFKAETSSCAVNCNANIDWEHLCLIACLPLCVE